MNSILQALVRTPPLRNYFLSDGHNWFCYKRENRTIVTRKSESSNKMNRNSNNNPQLCLACDFDAILLAVFYGDRVPYSPSKFLYSWWQHASNLASYEQQDAHEFFISMLDGILEKMQKDRRKPHSHVLYLKHKIQCAGSSTRHVRPCLHNSWGWRKSRSCSEIPRSPT